jgi:hypothetical protein
MAKSEGLTAYNVKLKKKVPFEGTPTIVKTARGGYMVKGVAKGGSKMVQILSKENALAAIKEGIAKKGY